MHTPLLSHLNKTIPVVAIGSRWTEINSRPDGTEVISAGRLGSDSRYTTLVLNTLSGWNSAWDLQRSRHGDASFQVWVSSNSFQQLLDYESTGIAPDNFQLRFATRSVTVTT